MISVVKYIVNGFCLKANATNYGNIVAQRKRSLGMWKRMTQHNILSCEDLNLGRGGS